MKKKEEIKEQFFVTLISLANNIFSVFIAIMLVVSNISMIVIDSKTELVLHAIAFSLIFAAVRILFSFLSIGMLVLYELYCKKYKKDKELKILAGDKNTSIKNIIQTILVSL